MSLNLFSFSFYLLSLCFHLDNFHDSIFKFLGPFLCNAQLAEKRLPLSGVQFVKASCSLYSLGNYDFHLIVFCLFVCFLAVTKEAKVSGVLLHPNSVTFLLTLSIPSEVTNSLPSILLPTFWIHPSSPASTKPDNS